MTFRNLIRTLALVTLAACSTGDPAGGGDPDLSGSAEDTPAGAEDTALPEVAPDTPPGPGPTCYEALTCLVDLKNWTGGPPPSESDCLQGIDDQEMGDVDALLGCLDTQCAGEFVAFEEGGDLELGALYLCLINHCAEPASVCIGGQGEDSCGDALWCLAGCNPYAQGCTTSCIAQTSQAQAEKTGKFLQCVLDVCPLAEFEMDCVPASCALKCPEVI
ncbi:MAG: hypothetical protein ABIK09_12305 [Pseudomonadota bacterium]